MVAINGSEMSTTGSITNSIFKQYFPGGNQLVKNTSYSTEGVQNRTLHSTVFEDVASGFNLYRNPRSVLKFNQLGVSSSLESLLTGGGETAFGSSNSIVIKNPEDGNANSTLSGGTAFARVLGDGKLIGTAGYNDISGSIIRNIFNSQTTSQSLDGTNVDGHSHNPGIVGTYDPSAPSGGRREVALSSQMTEEEKGWIVERGKYLTTINENAFSAQDRGILSNGWDFDIPNEYVTKNLKYADNGGPVSNEIILYNSQRAYIAPALIEFLIYISSKLDFYGGFGTGRNWSVALINGSSLTNHRVGRAIDISLIRTKDQKEVYNLAATAGDEQVYIKAFELLMSAINTGPTFLQPDMIIVSDEIGRQYGIDSGENGTEPASSEIRMKYPNVPYTQFYSDLGGSHRDHIHISFLEGRSGIYSGPNGQLQGTIINTPPPPGDDTPPPPGDDRDFGDQPRAPRGGNPNIISLSNPKFRTSYQASNSGELVANEIFDLLSNICYPELAAILTAISQREGNVGTINADLTGNDLSIGFLQNNFFGTHGNVAYILPHPQPTLIAGYKLFDKFDKFDTWEEWKLDVLETYNSYKSLGLPQDLIDGSFKGSSNHRLWYPINQAWIAYTAMVGEIAPYPFPLERRLGESPQMRHVLTPWGDYRGRGAPVAGPIYKTKFKDARNVYMRKTGKSKELATKDLSDWVIAYFSFQGNGATSRSVPYIDRWLDGVVFNRDGSENSVVPL